VKVQALVGRRARVDDAALNLSRVTRS
jgi:hypothetical protein